MAVVVARGCAFVPAVGAWFKQAYARERWAEMVVLTPTARVASRLREELALGAVGMLPVIAPLGGSDALAERIGFVKPAVCDVWAGRGELARWLGEQAPLTVRGWQRAEELWALLNRLALHGIDAKALRRGLPEAMLGFWEVQAEIVLSAMAHMQGWLRGRKEVLPGEAERMVVVRAGEILDGKEVVIAGVVDAPAPAVAMVKTVVTTGAEVVVPEGEMGTAWLEGLGVAQGLRIGVGKENSTLEEIVAKDGWDEARAAALAVRDAVARGEMAVAAICPERGFAAKVRAELAALGIVAFDSAADSLADTTAGRAVLAQVEGLVRRFGTAVQPPVRWRLALGEMDELVALALARLDGIALPVNGEVYAAMVKCALREAAAPARDVTPGVWVLGALEARLLDFETVVVTQMVEGVWPAFGVDAWLSEAHLRAVGLPDEGRKALLAAAEWQGLAHGGSGKVVVTRALADGEKLLVASRFMTGERLVAGGYEVGEVAVSEREALGCFVPEGAMWPQVWSASMVEDLLACPYRAMGRRVLNLEPLDPLEIEPDARVGGLLAHRWLEMAAKEIPAVDEAGAEAAVARLMALGDLVLNDVDAVVRALWKPRFAKLAPALVARWVKLGRRVKDVETRHEKQVGKVTVRARFDRVEEGENGAVIVDYKTTTPPGWNKLVAGVKPQLPLEAWLLEAAAEVEFWHLKGYGTQPLRVLAPSAKTFEAMLAPVAGGVARLVETFGEGQPFPAVPDQGGGGLLPTGVCEHCSLAGVCRRQGAV
jgi:RecB family exonuclease